MDPSRFDDLARLLSGASGRRSLLRVLLGAALTGSVAEAAAKPRDKGKGKDRDRNQDRHRARDQEHDRLQAEGRGKNKRRKKNKKKRGGSGGQPPPPDGCCGAESCPDPEPGSTRSECDFAGRKFAGQDHNGSLFRGIDGRNAVFTATDNHGSVFAEACLNGARFRRARLDDSTWGDACLFDADFTGADFGDDLTLFDNALFCHTTMPDGSVNDRDCERATACCQAALGGDPCQRAADCAGEGCRTVACQNGQCVYSVVADGPDPSGECGSGSSGHCCEGECCNPGATECNPTGLCCAPNCAGKQCGPDGCGGNGTCGACPAGEDCDEQSGQCVANCRPANCPNGCCDGAGVCRPRSNAFCGETCGFFCAVGQECLEGKCVCNAAACPHGCCTTAFGDPRGTCISPPIPPLFCGVGGVPCVECPQSGCCDLTTNTCVAGTTPQACGALGHACAVCPPGTPCLEGHCQCNAATCANGCCVFNSGAGDPGFCVIAGESSSACGTGGGPCANCAQDGQLCCGGVCRQPDGGACNQDSDCCSLNCFNGVCTERVTQCEGNPCNPSAKGCCGGACCDSRCCGGVCCATPCCGGVCCAAGQQCCGDFCCANGLQCCGSGACCNPDNEICCGGACGPAVSQGRRVICCGGTRCPGAIGCCGNDCCCGFDLTAPEDLCCDDGRTTFCCDGGCGPPNVCCGEEGVCSAPRGQPCAIEADCCNHCVNGRCT